MNTKFWITLPLEDTFFSEMLILEVIKYSVNTFLGILLFIRSHRF